MSNKTIWALTDGRPGNDNQTLAVAEKLGAFEVKRIEFSFLAKLHNFLLGRTFIGVKNKPQPPYPDIVISAGRKLSRIARTIKKRSNAKIVQLMWPGFGHQDFDLIFTPKHDNLPPKPNLIEIIGSPNRVTPNLLEEHAAKWRGKIPFTGKPVVSVLVGNVTNDEADKLIRILSQIKGYLLISTSRRTSAYLTNALRELKNEKYFFEWKAGAENPYFAFLGLADFIIVTGDSQSMCAESVTTGKPAYIFNCEGPPRHTDFTNYLIESGKARALIDCNLKNYEYQPLDMLNFATNTIREKLES